MLDKLTLGVVFGSRTCEHEVSVISAIQLMRHVDQDKYTLVPVYISQRGAWYTGDALLDINTYRPTFKPETRGLTRVLLDTTARSGALVAVKRAKLLREDGFSVVARLDCVIPVLHGLHGEDGSLQGLFEMAEIPYASTGVVGSAVGMDKILMKRCFQGMGFPVLPGVEARRSAFEEDADKEIARIEQAIPYPVFVKPANLGSSIGVSPAKDRAGLKDALELAFSYDRRVLVEKGVDKPLEVNCSVMGFDNDVTSSVLEMPVVEGEMLDYDTKYTRSGCSKGMASLSRVVPAPIGHNLTAFIRSLSCDIFRALDCKGVVRIDYMLEPATDKVYITEINTIPGSLAFYLWDKSEPAVPYHELIDRMVTWALIAQDEKGRNAYAHKSAIFENTAVGAKGAKGTKV